MVLCIVHDSCDFLVNFSSFLKNMVYLSVCLFVLGGWGRGGQALSGEDGQALSRGGGGQALCGGWVGRL